MCSSLVNTLLIFAMLHNEKTEDRSSNVHVTPDKAEAKEMPSREMC